MTIIARRQITTIVINSLVERRGKGSYLPNAPSGFTLHLSRATEIAINVKSRVRTNLVIIFKKMPGKRQRPMFADLDRR